MNTMMNGGMNYGEIEVIEMGSREDDDSWMSPELALVPIPVERAGWQSDRYDAGEWQAVVRRVAPRKVEKFDVRVLLRNLFSLS